MRKHIYLITGLALAVWSTPMRADQILGVSSSQTGAGAQANGVYAIDTATGNSTLLATASGITPPATNNVDGPNGLAFALGNVYYSTLSNTGNSQLWHIDLATSHLTQLGALTGAVASGTIYNGDYYYINQAGELGEVNLAAPFTNVQLKNYGTMSFGDIAVNRNGILYGSSNVGFFSIDLSDPTLALHSISGPATSPLVQLAFDATGTTLYGIQTGSATIFTVDTSTGVYTPDTTLTNSALVIDDAASYSSSAPEPATVALAGLALLAGGVIRRRARNAERGPR